MRFLLNFACFSLAIVFFGVSSKIFAHDLPVCEMSVVAAKESLHMEIVLNSSDLIFYDEIDVNRNGILDTEELDKLGHQISKMVIRSLSFHINGKPVEASTCGIVPSIDTHHLTVRAHYPIDARRKTVKIMSRLASIARNTQAIRVVFRSTASLKMARLDARNPEVQFRYQRETPSSVRPASLTVVASDKSYLFWLYIGTVVVLGLFFSPPKRTFT